jgi:hypothetical protein
MRYKTRVILQIAVKPVNLGDGLVHRNCRFDAHTVSRALISRVDANLVVYGTVARKTAVEKRAATNGKRQTAKRAPQSIG